MESLKCSLKRRALSDITNTVTEKQYRRGIDMFSAWAKQVHRVRLASDVTDAIALTQEYADYLRQNGYSADTIHTYLAPVAKGFAVPLEKIQKPMRKASGIRKTRQKQMNKQGLREMVDSSNSRIVAAANAIGVRRSELAKLTGACLVNDYAGNLCVLVRRGKGGKAQMQRILPHDTALVQSLFSGVAPRERVFCEAELSNKIPIHALRRRHAQESYDYYLGQIHKGHRDELIDDLKTYYLTYHVQQSGPAGDRRFAKQYARFCEDLTKGNGLYSLRGENKIRAQQAGRPTEYDRVALMAVSVFHLAHWRNDVTARNYMI